MSLKTRQIIMTTAKLGIGVIAAVIIAWELHLMNIYSAGSIALITLLTSKWDSLRTSGWRLATYFITVAVTFLLEMVIPYPIICFGLAISVIYVICELLEIRSVVAVNGVICSHFVASQNFTFEMIVNEFLIVLIGVVCAIIFNQFYSEKTVRKELVKRMRKAEKELSDWLNSLADQLENGKRPLPSLKDYERKLTAAWELANDFDDNSWSSSADYYKEYFTMRLRQVQVLQNLDWELEHLSTQPRQTRIIAEYIRYLVQFIYETHLPVKQEEELQRLLAHLKQEELPKTREEFENRSILFHVLMTLEEFITLKERFIRDLSPAQKRVYWKQNNPEEIQENQEQKVS